VNLGAASGEYFVHVPFIVPIRAGKVAKALTQIEALTELVILLDEQ
jgi:hypothetical protein